MSKSDETRDLAAEAVDIVFEGFFRNFEKIPEKLPEEAKEMFKASTQKMIDYFRNNAIELYEELLTKEELEELINFHNSEMGKSIRKAQAEIQSQMNERMKAFNQEENETGNGMISSINIVRDFNDPDS